jgi:hypothetical protein
MNIMIGLCLEQSKNWPNPLHKLNYKISVIEASIPESNPDIVFTNKKKNHSIFVDCKSKTLEEKQIQRYCDIRTNPQTAIRRGIVDIVHEDHFHIDPSFVSFSDLSKDELIIKYNMVFLHVNEHNNVIERITKENGEFNFKDINDVFPIETGGYQPYYGLYPFDETDIEIFTIYVLRKLFSFALDERSFSTEDLLQQTHPYWDLIDMRKQKKFEKIAVTILNHLEQKGLERYLKRENGTWNISVIKDPRSILAFQQRCLDIESQLEFKTLQDLL